MNDESVIVPAQSGRAVHVERGSRITVVDVQGHQVGDMWALVPGENLDWLSPAQTRNWLDREFPRPGQSFYSYLSREVLSFVEDTSPGIHDMQYPPCDQALYDSWGAYDHPSCRSNFLAAVESAGLQMPVVPEPVNLFQNTLRQTNGGLDVGVAASNAGDAVTLLALTDLLFVLTACSVDDYATNDWKCTELEIRLQAA